MSEQQREPFEGWAILELFGHNQIAGLVSEQPIGGGSFVRIDVPDTLESPPFTKFYNPSAVYALTPCTREAALIAAARLQIRPVTPWVVPNAKALPEEPEGNINKRYPEDTDDPYNEFVTEDDLPSPPNPWQPKVEFLDR
jgi:hypothetical protein